MDQDADRIRQLLMEDISEEDPEDLDDIPDSDLDEQDHQSDSDHDTNSLIDDSDADPDFVLGSGATSVVESSSSEDEDIQERVATREGNIIQNENDKSTYDETIEAVVAGAGDNFVVRPVLTPRSREYWVGKDKTTKWKKVCNEALNVRTRAENIIRHLPGPVNNGRNAKTPLECFQLMISDQIIQMITDCTNIYINKIKMQYGRERDCRQTTSLEIKAFIGLLLFAGSIRSNHQNLKELWNKDGTGLDVFYGTMSMCRFLFLMRCIRFDNVHDRGERRQIDKFAPLRELFEMFVHNCEVNFSVGEFVTIDEQLVPFRGRCPFRQYMKSKPAKYGIKIYTMTDSKTFYVKTMEVYVGKQPEDSPFEVSNKPKDVVLRLSTTISNSGRNITADNWFSSIPLAKELLTKKLTYVGTLKKDKAEVPPEMIAKKRNEYETIFGFQLDTTLLSYAPKKNRTVLLVTTLHHDDKIDDSTGVARKPEVITFYNTTKTGVDVVDQKCGTYSTSRKCSRWPLVVFYRLLDIAGVNAEVIYLFNNVCQKVVRRLFLKEIAIALIKPMALSRVTMLSLPKDVRHAAKKVSGHQDQGEQPVNPGNGEARKARCTVCPRNKDIKVKTSCEVCKKAMCVKHMKTVCGGCLFNENDDSD